jgi:peptidoglycan/LPS O-acetylase OafA/YrhL
MFAGETKPAKMKFQLNQKSERQFYIDWLRILLILSVFLLHVGMKLKEKKRPLFVDELKAVNEKIGAFRA